MFIILAKINTTKKLRSKKPIKCNFGRFFISKTIPTAEGYQVVPILCAHKIALSCQIVYL